MGLTIIRRARPAGPSRGVARWLVCGWLAVALSTLPAAAQENPPQGEEKKLPAPEEHTLKTKDGVALAVTYFPGTEGKETVPVVCLHDWKGSRADFLPLAKYLQSQGHAVVLVDLRGHGDSTQQAGRSLRADRLRPIDFQAMVAQDLVTVKRFLLDENNAQRVNIEKLTVVGAGAGAMLATYWTTRDWSLVSYPNLKVGHDIRALVLISPRMRFQEGNMSFTTAYSQRAFPKKLISAHIVVGTGLRDEAADAERIYKLMEPHAWQGRDASPEEIVREKNLFLDTYDTKLQGTKMLDAGLGLEERIGNFIKLRLVNQRYEWTDRTSPLSG